MSALIAALAGLSVLANAVVYGTDVFGALVQRPAMASVDDPTLVQAMGQVHRVADRRFPPIGAFGLVTSLAATVLAVVDGAWAAAGAGGAATVALLAFLAVYSRVNKPINAQLTAAATAHRTPADARELQTRWDAVIDARVALQAVALAGLCVVLATA